MVRLLKRLEGEGNQDKYPRGIAARINSLTMAGRVPREIAALMRVVSEMRNVSEYGKKEVLPKAEQAAVAAAWRAISDWVEEITIVRIHSPALM